MQTNANTKVAVIMRGLPGSGKSHWLNTYLASLPLEQALAVKQRGYFSTDSYFYKNGRYQFQGQKLSEYHQKNLTAFIAAMGQNEPTVICDNTNMAHWESSAYRMAAKALGYQVREVLIGDPADKEHQILCAKRNQHGVSLENIVKMARGFEA